MRKCRGEELWEDYSAHSSFKTSCQEEQMGMAEELDMDHVVHVVLALALQSSRAASHYPHTLPRIWRAESYHFLQFTSAAQGIDLAPQRNWILKKIPFFYIIVLVSLPSILHSYALSIWWLCSITRWEWKASQLFCTAKHPSIYRGQQGIRSSQ